MTGGNAAIRMVLSPGLVWSATAPKGWSRNWRRRANRSSRYYAVKYLIVESRQIHAEPAIGRR
jgi:hypothetical protein